MGDVLMRHQVAFQLFRMIDRRKIGFGFFRDLVRPVHNALLSNIQNLLVVALNDSLHRLLALDRPQVIDADYD
jgi:hypothetical protein